MNLKNKVVLISASVLTASALVIASPALAHKGSSKSTVTATSTSVVATPTPTAIPTPPAFNGPGDRGNHHGKGHHGKGKKPKGFKAPFTQTVTVDVPETGSYQLLVTVVKPATAPTPAPGATTRPAHSFTVPVTGTGSQTVTVNLPHPGQYTVSLISVTSSQVITVAPPVK